MRIVPSHRLSSDAPSRGVKRITPRTLTEGPKSYRTTENLGHDHAWSPGMSETSYDAGHTHQVVIQNGKVLILPAGDRHSHRMTGLTEERAQRSGAVAVSEKKGCNKCGRTDRDMRAGLCDKCAFPSKKNEATEDEELTETVGVFIRIPEWLAAKWPKNTQDDSPPHVTMLYVGACTPDKYEGVREALREVCKDVEPFTLDVSDYGEFVATKPGVAPEKNMTIAHMIPRVMDGKRELAEIHEKLWAACERRGITCDHFRDGPFKPHITLKYMQPGSDPYDGPRPQGRFTVRYLDLWGASPDSVFGYARLPLGSAAKGGGEKPKAALVSDARLSEAKAFRVKRVGPGHYETSNGWEIIQEEPGGIGKRGWLISRIGDGGLSASWEPTLRDAKEAAQAEDAR